MAFFGTSYLDSLQIHQANYASDANVRSSNLTILISQDAFPIRTPKPISLFSAPHKEPSDNLVKVDPPQFTVTVTSEAGPRVQHCSVIRHQNIPLLPSKSEAHASIIQHLIHDRDDILAIVLDCDFTCRELGLGCVPWLIPAHTRGIGPWVVDHEWQVLKLRVPEAIVVHSPFRCFQALDRIGSR